MSWNNIFNIVSSVTRTKHQHTSLTTPHRKQWGFLTDNIMQKSYIIFKLWIPVFLLEQWTLQSSTTFSTLTIVFCISTWKYSQSPNFNMYLIYSYSTVHDFDLIHLNILYCFILVFILILKFMDTLILIDFVCI